MASRRFRKELQEHLPEWQAKGWVTPEGALALRATYPESSGQTHWGAILRATFGTLLVGGGLILLLAHNWDQFPRGVRVAFALLPLLASVGLGAWALATARTGMAWREGTGILNTLGVATSISIVAQVYHISGDTPRFLLTWAIATLLPVYLLRSAVCWVIFQVLAVSWAWWVKDSSWAMPGYLGLLVVSFPLLLIPSFRREQSTTVATLWFAGFLLLSNGLAACLRGVYGGMWYLSVYLAWFALTLLIASNPRNRGAWIALWLSRFSMGGILLSLTFTSTWHTSEWVPSWSQEGGPLRAGILLGLILIPLCLSLYRQWHALHRTDAWWIGAGLLATVLTAAHVQGVGQTPNALLANLAVAALAGITLVRALREGDVGRLNLGWLLFSALILMRFFDTSWTYLLRGIVFIALGFGFLLFNKLVKKRKAAL